MKVFSLETVKAILSDAETCISNREQVIEKCAEQFRMYERNHRAKSTPDATEKAEVNRMFAEMCETILKEKS